LSRLRAPRRVWAALAAVLCRGQCRGRSTKGMSPMCRRGLAGRGTWNGSTHRQSGTMESHARIAACFSSVIARFGWPLCLGLVASIGRSPSCRLRQTPSARTCGTHRTLHDTTNSGRHFKPPAIIIRCGTDPDDFLAFQLSFHFLVRCLLHVVAYKGNLPNKLISEN
jgi:hypothetical protein